MWNSSSQAANAILKSVPVPPSTSSVTPTGIAIPVGVTEEVDGGTGTLFKMAFAACELLFHIRKWDFRQLRMGDAVSPETEQTLVSEFAHLVPGHNRLFDHPVWLTRPAVGQPAIGGGDKDGRWHLGFA